MARHAVRIAPRITLYCAALLVAAACGPPWHLVRASGPPSALAGASSFGVAFDYSALLVEGDSESAWLEALEPDERDEYLALRAELEVAFVDELEGALAGATFGADTGAERHRLVVRYTLLDVGALRPIYSTDSRLDATVTFGDAGGVTDEITVATSRHADVYNPERRGRLTWCARRVAALAAEYIRRAQ